MVQKIFPMMGIDNDRHKNSHYRGTPCTYSGLHKNWPFAYFEKITVAVGWVYIKVWPIPHLKALTPTFWPT